MLPQPPRSTLFPYTTLFRSALEKMSPAITSDAMPMRMVTIQPIGSEPGWKSRPSAPTRWAGSRSEEHTSELQSLRHLVCRLLLEKKKKHQKQQEATKTRKNQ